MEPSPLAGREATEVGLVIEAVFVEEAVVEVDLDAVASDLDAVDHALLRLDAGAYGTCEVCEAALPDEALADDPVARRCQEHQGH